MAAGNTYDQLFTTTLTTDTSSVTISSIPATYTDLILVANAWTTSGGNAPWIRLNGDTGANYSSTTIYGTGSVAASSRSTSVAIMYTGGYYVGIGTTISTMTIQLQNYSNSTTYKTVLSRLNSSQYETEAVVGLWRSTAAINSITVSIASSLIYAAGSSFTLYGIVAA